MAYRVTPKTKRTNYQHSPHSPARNPANEPSCPLSPFPVTPRRCDASAKEPVPSSPRAIASPSTPRGSSARRTRRFGPPKTRVKSHSRTPPASAASSPVRETTTRVTFKTASHTIQFHHAATREKTDAAIVVVVIVKPAQVGTKAAWARESAKCENCASQPTKGTAPVDSRRGGSRPEAPCFLRLRCFPSPVSKY